MKHSRYQVTGFFGGALSRDGELSHSLSTKADWSFQTPNEVMFIYARGHSCKLFQWDSLALLIRGTIRSTDSAELEQISQSIYHHYLEYQELPIGSLEGSYSLVLMDGSVGRTVIYRNLVGNGSTFYSDNQHGFSFASTIPTLLDSGFLPAEVNEELLPSVFLHRCSQERETLFKKCLRLMPGEQVEYQSGAICHSQRRTLGDLYTESTNSGDPLQTLEEILNEILTDYASENIPTGNLLSGGVDSSLLQACWNRCSKEDLAHSFCVTVDHPHSRQDTNYAKSASELLQTTHHAISATNPYESYLIEVLSTTGQLPNHVQAVYFRHLAKSMIDRQFYNGLCGETADSLFGMGQTLEVQTAQFLKKYVPGSFCRTLGSKVAGLLGKKYLKQHFELANVIYRFEHPHHPVNQVAVFSDVSKVRNCFGTESVEQVLQRRRGLLEDYHVPNHPVDRLNWMNFLGSSMNSASLWTTLFNSVGADLHCPFLDSRLLRFVINLPRRTRFPFRQPKQLLKRALAQQATPELAYRKKLGFGQPIFEWMSVNDQLHPRIQQIDDYDFLRGESISELQQNPGWFLYTLLCFDIWHKLFIQRTLPRSQNRWWESRPQSQASIRSEVGIV